MYVNYLDGKIYYISVTWVREVSFTAKQETTATK
jgi:hypothetical protein